MNWIFSSVSKPETSRQAKPMGSDRLIKLREDSSAILRKDSSAMLSIMIIRRGTGVAVSVNQGEKKETESNVWLHEETTRDWKNITKTACDWPSSGSMFPTSAFSAMRDQWKKRGSCTCVPCGLELNIVSFSIFLFCAMVWRLRASHSHTTLLVFRFLPFRLPLDRMRVRRVDGDVWESAQHCT